MKIHNSLTNKTEEFEPIDKGRVKLYTCGPTVYNHAHIGNFRTYVFEDSLRRTLKADGYKFDHVMNITDIDDKTIARSRDDYPELAPADALKKLTSHYEKVFLEDAGKIGIDLSESKIVRATDHIDQMQALIHQIPNKYVGDDGVYYDITKDSQYGILVKLDRAHQHHRINNDEYDKDHVADFALWKKQSGDEPAWPLEVDGQDVTGRPGWHIECSAMSVQYLGQPFDIHTGGVDLKFPHHENEIAQSRSAGQKNLANYFMHGEYLLADGRKMSKKLDNFYTLSDITEKGYEPLALRLLFLQAHYRSQLNFTWESLEAAASNLKSLRDWADLAHQTTEPLINDDETFEHILSALKDDLNTPKAIALLNEYAGSGKPPSAGLLKRLDGLFGLALSGRPDISQSQKQLIEEREAARQSKNWAKSDELRQTLTEQGIEIKDSSSGPIWSRQ